MACSHQALYAHTSKRGDRARKMLAATSSGKTAHTCQCVRSASAEIKAGLIWSLHQEGAQRDCAKLCITLHHMRVGGGEGEGSQDRRRTYGPCEALKVGLWRSEQALLTLPPPPLRQPTCVKKICVVVCLVWSLHLSIPGARCRYFGKSELGLWQSSPLPLSYHPISANQYTKDH